MNIHELDSYDLGDAVKFNDHLNPRIWGADEKLLPEVRKQLLKIADDFREFLGIDVEVKDITISGSNAAYTYTPQSDIDLHLVVDLPRADASEVYRELFDAKKYAYNDQQNITIGGHDVELYVQDANKGHVSQGIYSIQNDDWVSVPNRRRPTINDISVESKFQDLGHRIESAIASGDYNKITALIEKIKKFRQAGLDQHGEFAPENLAFKILRTQGLIKQLYDARNTAKDQQLSITERKNKKKKKVKYGFGGYWYPGTGYAGQDTPAAQAADGGGEMQEDVGMTWDGVSPTTDMFTTETSEQTVSDEDILRAFIDFCVKELKIEQLPTVKLRKDPQWPVIHKTFGRYNDDRNLLEVAWGSRHIMDVLRTVAHELTHKHQHEREDVPSTAGETGSRYENEANARAGVLMRDWARLHPEYFEAGQAEELKIDESASGYIPTKAQAKDPRFSMALTVDIKPGQVGKEANKLNLKTNKQGIPQVANPNGLFEKLALELNQFKKKGTLFVESEQLDEVRMAPSNLKQFAQSPEAEGIRAGFEAELIFRDTNSGDDDDSDMEPDYDQDERCRSISQVVEFFQDDEWGYGLTERQASQLQDSLDERYMEWMDEQMYDSWRDERDELIKDAWLREKPMGERIHAALVDGLDLTDEQADAVERLAADREAGRINGSDMSEEQLDMISQYSEARSIAEDILQEDVEQTLEKEDGFYDEVLDDFRNDFYVDDDSGFFQDVGLRYMSDVAEEYDLGWPYMTGGAGNGGSRDWDSIGDSLHDAIGMPVKVSSGYHSATRKEGLWIVEPDSSLDPDDREDYGLEIVSPPMPLAQALEKLQQVTDWANSNEGNAYTNDSTGLHMGVSIPFKEGRVDYLKLVLFLGDEYVLEQFGRESNTYTKAAMKEIRQRAGSEANATRVLELLKNNLIELAEREIAKSTGEGKYTSAHKQGKYIEFRSAGGDWLAEDNAEPGKLENTMMRYAYAMYLAGRPDLERREYAKKLYKLVASGEDASTMALFSQYAAGELDKDQLKKRWAEKTLSKEAPGAIAKGEWVVINNSTGKPVEGQSYNGYTKDEVRDRAKAKISPASSDTDFDLSYSIEPQNTGRWEVYRDDQGQEETLEIIDADRRGEAVDKAYDKYTGVIPFKVRAYYGDAEATPEKELSPRAKLAKRIVKTKPTQDYDVVYRPTGRVVDSILRVDAEQAQRLLSKVAQQHDFKNTDDLELRLKQESEPDLTPGDWQFVRTDTGYIIDRVNSISPPQAEAVRRDWVRRYNLDDNQVSAKRIQDTSAQQTYSNYADAQAAANQQNRREDNTPPVTGNTKRFRIADNEANVWGPFVGDAQNAQNELRNIARANPGTELRIEWWGDDIVPEGEPDVAQNFNQQPEQARTANGVPIWELYDKFSNSPLYTIINPAADAAWKSGLGWLRDHGAEDPTTYTDRFGIRPKMNTVSENFADGKGPGRPGDSQRHGIPKGATIAQLEKAAQAPGRKGQLARWQLNMRRGKARAK